MKAISLWGNVAKARFPERAGEDDSRPPAGASVDGRWLSTRESRAVVKACRGRSTNPIDFPVAVGGIASTNAAPRPWRLRDGQETVLCEEPEAGCLKRPNVGFKRVLPIGRQL
jgi:hypothetical protein